MTVHINGRLDACVSHVCLDPIPIVTIDFKQLRCEVVSKIMPAYTLHICLATCLQQNFGEPTVRDQVTAARVEYTGSVVLRCQLELTHYGNNEINHRNFACTRCGFGVLNNHGTTFVPFAILKNILTIVGNSFADGNFTIVKVQVGPFQRTEFARPQASVRSKQIHHLPLTV